MQNNLLIWKNDCNHYFQECLEECNNKINYDRFFYVLGGKRYCFQKIGCWKNLKIDLKNKHFILNSINKNSYKANRDKNDFDFIAFYSQKLYINHFLNSDEPLSEIDVKVLDNHYIFPGCEIELKIVPNHFVHYQENQIQKTIPFFAKSEEARFKCFINMDYDIYFSRK